MIEAVLTKIPDHLMKLARVYPHGNVLRLHGDLEVDPGDLVGGDEIVRELRQPVLERQELGLCRLAAADSQHVFDNGVHAYGVFANHFRQPTVALRQTARLAQELSRVADSAQRIANLVGDARGHPSEGGKLELLRLLGQGRRVLDKHQHAVGGILADARKGADEFHLRAVVLKQM